MKLRILSACAVAACVCAVAWGAAAQEAQPAEPKVSGGERSAAEKIDKAKGAEAKIQAAAEFLKKYPQSPLRPRVAEAVASEVGAAADPQLKASLGETYLALFNAPGEADRVSYHLLDAYIMGERAEEAFRAGAAWLQKNPDDVETMRRLVTTGFNASIRGNNGFLAPGLQHGAKALELLEADKRPASLDEARWAKAKSEWVPELQRELGIMAFRSGDRAGARRHLGRAVELKHPDPAVYLILGEMANEEYNQLAQEYKIAPAGAAKDALLQKVEASLDRVIETFAQIVAVTAGNAQYQAAHEQIRQDLESYYKYRHKGSTDGLQQMIDKYRRP